MVHGEELKPVSLKSRCQDKQNGKGTEGGEEQRENNGENEKSKQSWSDLWNNPESGFLTLGERETEPGTSV